jgi:glutamate dehydrogenase (NAD(P)+)
LEDLNLPLGEATAVVQGVGNVGSETALALQNYGVKVIAVSDYTGACLQPAGLEMCKKAVFYVKI